jgi:N-acyl-D-amino-acid deacylase
MRLVDEPFDALDRDVRAALRDPFTTIGTDGLPVGTGGRPHPRGYGTFPRIFEHYVKDEAVIPLADAVRRMTSLPAEIFGLERRGRIKVDHIADLVLLDPAGVKDNATFAQPTLPPLGIDDVFVGGERVVDNGRWTGRRDGCYVRVDH